MIKNIGYALTLIMFAGTLSAQDVVVDNDVIYTDNTNKSSVESTSNSTTTVKSPPPSAIAPSINSANSDLCTVGVSGAVQTQILGISAGKTVRDMNCEKLKNAKVLYDMGMKVAAVSTMCQDPRVFKAMMNAGTPCPYDGLIGDAAKLAWENHKDDQPTEDEAKGILGDMDEDDKSTLLGGATIGGLLLLLLL
mgnify:CR=1 FL=1|tara:strand:- start:2101 stop:2679 length:579 start_codon:yes stop_codon:yes gene_type:complete